MATLFAIVLVIIHPVFFGSAILGIIVLTIVILSYKSKKAASKKNELIEKYALDEIYLSEDDYSFVGINFAQKKIVLGASKLDAALGHGLSEAVYNFEQVASTEIIENGATVTKTNRGSQIAGVALGGVVFGGVGALIGGLSGSTRSDSLTTSIVLRITVDDRRSPNYSINFFRAAGPSKINNLTTTLVRKNVERYHAHISNIIRDERVQQITHSVPENLDEIDKLWRLHQSGALTSEEFSFKKQQLLGCRENSIQATADPFRSRIAAVASRAPRPVAQPNTSWTEWPRR